MIFLQKSISLWATGTPPAPPGDFMPLCFSDAPGSGLSPKKSLQKSRSTTPSYGPFCISWRHPKKNRRYLPIHLLEYRLVACHLIQNEMKIQKKYVDLLAVYEILKINSKNCENRLRVLTFLSLGGRVYSQANKT